MNVSGNIGDGSAPFTAQRLAAVPVIYSSNSLPVDGMIGLAVGGSSQNSTQSACAWNLSGELYCWGHGPTFGLGSGGSIQTRALLHTGFSDVIHADIGISHICVVRSDTRVSCAGGGAGYKMGINSFTTQFWFPVSVTLSSGDPLMGATHVAAGRDHSCASLSNGTTWCWGFQSGGIGNGGSSNNNPQPIQYASTNTVVTDSVMVSSYNQHTCILTTGNGIHCFGTNTDGQLGYNNTTSQARAGPSILGE